MGNLMEVVPLVVSRYQQMRDYEELSRGHHRRLEVCHVKLADWISIWDENPQRAVNTYRLLWGSPATIKVTRRLGDIERRSIGIRQNLRAEVDELENCSGGREVKARFETVKMKRGFSSISIIPARKKSLDVGHRVVFAFFGDERLGNELDNLERDIDGLVTVSTHAFAEMGYIDHGQSPSYEYVNMCRKRAQIARFLEALYCKCKTQSQDFEWTIDMRMPLEDGQVSHLHALTKEARLDFMIRFSAKASEQTERSITHLSITQVDCYSGSVREMADLLVSDFALVRFEHVRFEDAVYHIAKEERPRREFFCVRNLMSPIDPYETGPRQSDYRNDCAKLYVATTLYFIISSQSGWFSHLDSSRVHCADLVHEERERFDVSRDDWKRYMYQPWNLPEGHTTQSLNELLALGMLLGEMALGTPIRVLTEQHSQTFVKEPYSRNPAMSKEQLLRDVYFFGGKQVEAVVKYCLEDRGEGKQQNQNVLSMTRKYEERILQPLLLHDRLIQRRREERVK